MVWAVFLILSFLCIGSVAAMIFSRNQAHNALFLVLSFSSLGGLFGLLDAPFAAAVQVLVYAGAIMVLFLFVIMLLDIRREQDPWAPTNRGRIVVAVVLSVVLLVELGIAVAQRLMLRPSAGPPVPGDFGTTQAVGRLLFTDFLFPFEITSIILLVAMVGAMVLAKKRLT